MALYPTEVKFLINAFLSFHGTKLEWPADTEYEIESLLDDNMGDSDDQHTSSQGNNASQYLVKWRNLPASKATWEPAGRLPRGLLQAYHAALPSKPVDQPFLQSVSDSDSDDNLKMAWKDQCKAFASKASKSPGASNQKQQSNATPTPKPTPTRRGKAPAAHAPAGNDKNLANTSRGSTAPPSKSPANLAATPKRYAGTPTDGRERICFPPISPHLQRGIGSSPLDLFGSSNTQEGRWALGLANPGILCSDRHRSRPHFQSHNIGYKEIMLMVGGKGVTTEHQRKSDQVFCFCMGNDCYKPPFESKMGRGGVKVCTIPNLKGAKHLFVAPEVLQRSDLSQWHQVQAACKTLKLELLTENGKAARHCEESSSPPVDTDELRL